MEELRKSVFERRSVRTFEDRKIPAEVLDKLIGYMERIDNPYGLKIRFRVLDASIKRLSCPVVVGTELYVGAKMKASDHFNEAFGYSFERFVLYAQSLGIGTVWIGGTMDRGAFERVMELAKDEVMPCVSPIGYPAKKMSVREALMRKGIKADSRMDFEKTFFDGDFHKPLTKESAGKLAEALEMVRAAPSAVNRQPWRVVLKGNEAHFYLKRARGLGGSIIDMQKIDMGIALCHFELAAHEIGFNPVFSKQNPGIPTPDATEYIATYTF